jgi:hypothetical protein
VQQAVSIIRRVVAYIREKDKQDSIFRDKELIKKLDERIDDLLYFIFNIEDTHGLEDTETLEKIPEREHQRIFKDFLMMESLVDLL